MSLPDRFYPKVGMILMCDFGTGFRKPEMVKKRPVIILTEARQQLVTVVPLSTTEPIPTTQFHHWLEKQYLPNTSYFQRDNGCWVKGDMLYTVCFDRLTLISVTGAGGNRNHFTRKLGKEIMREVRRCVLYGLNLGKLSDYL